MSFDLIVFDLGNVLTLVDPTPAAREFARLSGLEQTAAHDAVFAPEHKKPHETGECSFEQYAAGCCRRLGIELPVSRFRELHDGVLTPNMEIFPLVEQLMARYRVGMCSNTSEAHWSLERARLPFASRLDPVVLSYEVGVMKPVQRIYEAIARRSRVARDRILFIDDVAENVHGARAAGLGSIQYCGLVELQSDLRRLEVAI